ncbi:aminomethyltransferase [Amylibacter ulvae]|uniref:aminomethyltransferase n=1 Tax=Paramylibacter ulvae TaxID=1651968 RepID=A0ABQ3D658_9RHOB|nr:glycine cleavage system aminomethyltransferase GcvT [Amylibacter ulvae]GHA60809.1 aminomethyltransferase [Amylibacter ulvae]
MAELKQTPLYNLHVELGAKMVPFAGYDMPVQYPMGVMKEHLATRTGAGLFDVSHMGQVVLWPRSKEYKDAALALEKLVPIDVLGLEPMRQRYAFFTNDQGGIQDDLMVTNLGDHIFLVVNAACKDADIMHMQDNLSADCMVEVITDRALLALQGPKAETALAKINPEVANMKFMDVIELELNGAKCVVSRSGYTGEDGYEISVHEDDADALARALLADADVEPIGLGARDSLRLEAGLCLYGNDIDTETTPIEAALNWAIQKVRRKGGEREGGFVGSEIILDQMENGTARKRVGLLPAGRAPMRDGTPLFASETDDEQIGAVTSGGFGPTIEGPMSMGYVPTGLAAIGTEIFAEIRGKRMAATVTKMPFTPANFKR